MKLQTIIMGVIMGTAFMIAAGLLMGNISTNYSVTYSNETSLYDNLESTYNESLNIQGSLNTSADTTSSDLLGTLVDKGVAAVKITGGSVKNGVQMTANGLSEIGIPYQLQLVAVTILLIAFLIVIIRLYIRSDV